MKDLQLIKQKILEEDRIKELLEKMNCHNIKPESSGQRYTAALPDGDNPRSVQVKLNNNLSCAVRSKGIVSIDVYGLVSYICHSKQTEESIDKDLPNAKRWICEQLGYREFLSGNYKIEVKEDPLKWLKEKKRKKKMNFQPSTVLRTSILDEYVPYGHIKWFQEGLSLRTQQYFGVMYDVNSNRIVFPIHNKNGELVGIKGRRIQKKYEDDPKYIYLYPCNKSVELYNFHRALPCIEEKREVIVFESEKSCMFAAQYGIFNCVSVMGGDISEVQADTLKKIGLDVKIIIAFDKDKDADTIKKLTKVFGTKDVFSIYDKKKKEEDLLEGKDSPVDKGKEVFLKLYNERVHPVPK